MSPEPTPPPRPRLATLGRHWRLALALAALASLPLLYLLAGGAWSGAATRVELARAGDALAEGRPREARLRAERVLARLLPDAAAHAERRSLAAEAALLAAEARLAESALERQPAGSEIGFAAFRAAQGGQLGGDAGQARALRLRAARRLLDLGLVADAISEYERMAAGGVLGPEGEREMAVALASGDAEDRARALPILERLLASPLSARDAVLARIALGHALQRLGDPAGAVEAFARAAAEGTAASQQFLVQQAELEQGGALVRVGRAAEAAPLLRALLRGGLSREVREAAGVALAEADAVADEGSLAMDLGDLRVLPAAPEVMFAARARVARRRLEAGRRADAAATYAAAFEHLGSRPIPEAYVAPARLLADLASLHEALLDAQDLPALARAAEGLALCLPESEQALELAASVAARRALLADERAAAARSAGVGAEDLDLEARALHGRSAELYREAAEGPAVLKSHSVENRVSAAREMFRGGFWGTARPVLVRLSEELSIEDERAAEVRWMLARTVQELGLHDEAVAALSAFLAEHSDAPRWSHDAFFELARSLEALGAFERAENALVEFLFRYDNVTPDAPRWRDGLFALGDLQARLALEHRARGSEAAALDKAAQAERNLGEAVRRFPTHYAPRLRAEYRLGLLAMARRDWSAAAGRFQAALGLPLGGGAAADAEAAAVSKRCSLLLGESRYQLGDWGGAAAAFGQAWTAEGGIETVLALQRIAECHARLDDARQAERFAQRAREALAEFRARPAERRAAGAEDRLLERLVAGR